MKTLATTIFLVLLGLGVDGDAPRTWKDTDEGEALFARAVAHLEAGEYRELGETCKKLRSQAKDGATRELVASYLSAAEGGLQLERCREQARQGKQRAAYGDAQKAYARYAETPVGPAYVTFLEHLRGELFTVLEDFEKSGARYSEKFGKSFVQDPKFVKEGRQSLKWEIAGKNVSLKVEGLPKDLVQDHVGISMWVNFPAGTAPYRLVFACTGKSASTQGEAVQDSFYKAIAAQRGWTRIEADWKEFSQQGAADWSKVEDFRIQFDGRPGITLYVDDICLIKRSP